MAKKNDIVKAETASIQPVEQIESLIITIRGKQVILDRDLARLYGVETRRLNEQVKRNIERFPDDFMFQLSKEEVDFLRSQNATLEKGSKNHLIWNCEQGYLPPLPEMEQLLLTQNEQHPQAD